MAQDIESGDNNGHLLALFSNQIDRRVLQTITTTGRLIQNRLRAHRHPRSGNRREDRRVTVRVIAHGHSSPSTPRLQRKKTTS
jgi:hypothetical protein